MKLSIEPEVFARFHEQFVVGALFCSRLNNKGGSTDIHEMLVDLEELIRLNFTPEGLAAHKFISAWNAAVAHFGEKFHHYQSNVEVLMKHVLQGEELPRKDKLGDLVTFFSLKYIVPMGAFDVSHVAGNVRFTLADENDLFFQGKTAHRLENGELIFRDDEHVLSTKLQYEPSPRVLVSGKTTAALILIEALPPFGLSTVETLLIELGGLIRVFCDGKITRAMLSKEKPAVEFS